MALWDRFRRRRAEPYAAVTEEERISRYLYLLGTLPPSVVENAHRTAFAELSPQKRREMFEELRPFMSPEEQRAAPEPSLLARVMGRAQANGSSTAVLDREATQAGTRPDAGDQPLGFLFRNPVLVGLVAYQFLASQSLVAYFTVGAGSIGISGEPGWVGEIGGMSPADGAMGVDGAGFDGGGFDGGGFGGGFDGGGFGGGFGGGDGGGGF